MPMSTRRPKTRGSGATRAPDIRDRVMPLYTEVDQAWEEVESDLRASKPLTEAVEELRDAAKSVQYRISEGAPPGRIRDSLRQVESAARRAHQAVESQKEDLKPATRKAVRVALRRSRAVRESNDR